MRGVNRGLQLQENQVDDGGKMEISGCIGVRLQQAHPEVHRQVFDQPGGGVDERCLRNRQCLVKGGPRRRSILRERATQTPYTSPGWFLPFPALTPRKGARVTFALLLY